MRVAVLAPSPVQWLDLFGPMQVFLEAAKLSGHSGLYHVQVIGTAPGPIGGSCGVTVVPGRTIAGPDEAIDTARRRRTTA
jgi:hypothetical protein